jgi:hypothetical protein
MKKSNEIEIVIRVSDVKTSKKWLFEDTLKGIMEGKLKSTANVVAFQINRWAHLNPHDKCAVAYTVFSEVYKNSEYIYGKWMNAKIDAKVRMLTSAMGALYKEVG